MIQDNHSLVIKNPRRLSTDAKKSVVLDRNTLDFGN
jgi:hypothetical protein